MKRSLVLWVLLAAAVLNGGRAWAWNAIGHLASAKLAYDELDDGQKGELFALLQRHPHFAQYLAAGRPPEVSEMEWAILHAAVWPDWVRPRHNAPGPDPRGPSVTKYSRDEQHYVNVPVIDPKDAAFFAGKTLIPPDRTNVICALKQSCNDLRSRNAAAEDKAVAICWIFHLVGDIHQPLHNAAYFSSEEGFQQGDQGGNRFGVKINGRKWKLHAFWDNLLGEDTAYWDDSAEHQRQIFRDAMKVADHLRGLQLSDADKERLAKNCRSQVGLRKASIWPSPSLIRSPTAAESWTTSHSRRASRCRRARRKPARSMPKSREPPPKSASCWRATLG